MISWSCNKQFDYKPLHCKWLHPEEGSCLIRKHWRKLFFGSPITHVCLFSLQKYIIVFLLSSLFSFVHNSFYHFHYFVCLYLFSSDFLPVYVFLFFIKFIFYFPFSASIILAFLSLIHLFLSILFFLSLICFLAIVLFLSYLLMCCCFPLYSITFLSYFSFHSSHFLLCISSHLSSNLSIFLLFIFILLFS